jgi:hypothetical protein
MVAITVSAHYHVSPAQLWEELRHIDRHVQWMTDAASIEFLGDQREGVNTSFRCVTKVGPLVTNDLMTVTQWDDDSVMGVSHRGLITGRGTLTLKKQDDGTEITWREQLEFPWWMLEPLGAYVAKPVLRGIWSKNLRALGQILA